MEKLTTYIAIYGAVLSSIGIIWNISRDLKDKSMVKLLVGIGGINPDTDGYGRYLLYRITNNGRRPVVIDSYGGLKKKGKHFIFRPRSLQKTLTEGEQHTEYTHDLSVLDNNLKYLCVYDSFGRCYKFKGRKLKKLIDEQK